MIELNETLDAIFNTIEVKIKKDFSAIGTFRTFDDTYSVNLGPPLGKGSLPLEGGRSFMYPGVVNIMFSSQRLGMGHSGADANQDRTTSMAIYSTILKVIMLYLTKMKHLKKDVFGFSCSVAGDNARGSKAGIYHLLFKKAKRFGYTKIGDKLLLLRTDMYEKIKQHGVQLADGQVYQLGSGV